MKIVRIVFEGKGKIILNNSLVMDGGGAVDWFHGVDMLVDTLDNRFVLNTNNLEAVPCQVVHVQDNLYIIRVGSRAGGGLRVLHSSSHTIGQKKYWVELAGGEDSAFFTVSSKGDIKSAVDLGTGLVVPSVTVKEGKIVLQDTHLLFVYNPSNVQVEVHQHIVTHAPLQFLFLYAVKNGEWDKAKGYLAFNINQEQLKKYFGDFDIILNNYLGNAGVVSLLPKGETKTKNYKFEITNGRIANIDLV